MGTPVGRTLWPLLVATCLASGCGGRPAPLDRGGERDAGRDTSAADAASDGFCSGTPKMDFNGHVSETSVGGRPLVLDCCHGAQISVNAADGDRCVFTWQAPAGSLQPGKTTVDLAQLPAGWKAGFYLGCSPYDGCDPGIDGFETELTGTLTVITTDEGYRMTVCASGAEDPGQPHPLLHSLRLWTGDVTVSYR